MHTIYTWQGCSFVLVLPIPSMVVIATPSRAHKGIRQALTAECLQRSSSFKILIEDSIT